MDSTYIRQVLTDAGCPDSVIGEVIRLNDSGNTAEALHRLRTDRCRLMAELHESGRRVDCLDYLIRQAEKEMNTKA